MPVHGDPDGGHGAPAARGAHPRARGTAGPGPDHRTGRPDRPGRPLGRAHRLVRAAASAAAFGVPFVVLALVVRAELEPVVTFDEAVIRAATDVTRADPVLHAALLRWQEALRPVWVHPVMAAVCVWAWRRHGLRTRALWASVTLGVAWGLQLGAKAVVQRARPVVEDAVAQAPGSSFPSGHAANTATAAAVLTILLWPVLGRRGRIAVPALAATVALLTAADRVLLGVHYPSDVVAGILFGVTVTTASYVGYRGSTPHVGEVEPAPHVGEAEPARDGR